MSFYNKHRKIGRIVCLFRGHQGCHTRLVREDDEKMYYVNGCCRCNAKDLEFFVRRNNPDAESIVRAFAVNRMLGVVPIPPSEGRKFLWTGTKWISNQGMTVEEFSKINHWLHKAKEIFK